MSNLQVTQRNSVIPLLVGLSVPRTEGETIPGYYCDKSHVWMIDGPDGPEPLVHSSNAVLELLTKTLSFPESDDENRSGLLGALTKTSVQAESDDDQFSVRTKSVILELATKTEARQERDD